MLRALPPFLRGRKGGSSKFKNTPDTIRSEDSVEVLLGVGEGENFGLAEGAKSFLMGGTALVNSNNEPNVKDFVLTEYTGVPNAPAILPVLGGLGSPTAANAASLEQGTSVVRTGTLTQIDYLDLRFLIQQLARQDDKGVFSHNLQIKIEYRASLPAGQPWVLAWSTVPPIPPGYEIDDDTPGVIVHTGGTDVRGFFDDVVTFDGDDLYLSNEADAPAQPDENFDSLWLDADFIPHIFDGDGWTPGPGVTGGGTGGTEYWNYQGTRFYRNPLEAPLNPRVGDVWTPDGQPPLRFNGSSWVVPLIGSVANQGYAQPMRGTPAGILSVTEKITSPVVREVRVPVARIGVPYDIRVTKMTEDSSSDGKIASEVGWESFEEIVAEGRSYPNTHILHLIGRASDQFTNLPELLGDIKGRIIDVPSNYDPVTRTYFGVWDGVFKRAYTNNGAWCTRDFIRNSRYGLSALYPYEVKESSFYTWAQWCDQAVPDNKGGSRPRWTYNDDLSQPRPARDQVNYMAGSCGARLIDDGSGVFDVLIDKDEPMTMIVGPESVVDGEFVYSFTDIQTRANWVKVGFINPDLNWETDFRVVKASDFDSEPLASHIENYGRIPLEFVAAGKTNVSEALAAARLRLITSITEYTAVSFKINRIGRYLYPFKVIGVCDPDMGWGVSGRIHAKTGARQITLRDPVYLENGVTYKFSFNRPTSPITTVTVPITPGQLGSLTTINFSQDLPEDLPEFAQFALESYDAVTGDPIGLPKAFKILTITPSDGDNEIVEVTALELNRNKFAFSDGTGELLDTDEFSNFNGPIDKPKDVRVTATVSTLGGTTRRNLQVYWGRPSNPFARNTHVEYSRDGNQFTLLGESDTEFYEIEDVASGTHAIRLTHVHTDGVRKSQPVLVIHEVGSAYRNVPPVENLRLVDEPEVEEGVDPIFESLSPLIAWDHGGEDPNFKQYKVRLIFGTSTVRHTILTDKTELVIDYIKMIVKNLANQRARSFTVSVSKIDDFGAESPPAKLKISNPVPPAPENVLAFVDGDGFLVTWKRPTWKDHAGTKIYASLDPADLAEFSDDFLVFDGTSTQARVTVSEVGRHYFLVAHYDTYAPDQLGEEATDFVDIDTILADLLDVIGDMADIREDVDAIRARGDEMRRQMSEQSLADMQQTLLSVRQATERDQQTHLEGQPVGSVLKETVVKTDEAIQFNSLMGVMNGDQTAILLNRSLLMLTPEQTLAQYQTLLEARFSGTSSSYLLTSVVAAADAASAALSTLTQMGVDFEDVNAWQIDYSRIVVNPGTNERLNQRLTSIGIFQEDEGARFDSRISTALGPDGAIAEWASGVYTTQDELEAEAGISFTSMGGFFAQTTLFVRSNGTVGGIIAGVDGGNVMLRFVGDQFRFTDINGNNPIQVLSYTSGQWTLNANVVIYGNLIVHGTITTPALAANSISLVDSATSVGGILGGGGLQNAVTYILNLPYAAKVICLASGQNSYTASGDPAVSFNLNVNGGGLDNTGGSGTRIASMALMGHVNLPAGSHTVTVDWSGATSGVNLVRATLVILGVYK